MKKLNEKGSTLRGSKGFTLIELIVVIVVIGILAGLVIIRIGSASKDARNAKRKADLAQIRTAIEQYRAKGGTIDFG
ncbi:MAG: prepilin-type N-terminal cleavage/methylation domain-containing protein, partial [Flavobacteriales bacterium]|nr:prepilin-type N-terminal cleavage/methylation domain-containing protein [Flavobacteriales bacterium]